MNFDTDAFRHETIAVAQIGKIRVSTVFMGTGSREFFETMVFGIDGEEVQAEQFPAREMAVKYHNALVLALSSLVETVDQPDTEFRRFNPKQR